LTSALANGGIPERRLMLFTHVVLLLSGFPGRLGKANWRRGSLATSNRPVMTLLALRRYSSTAGTLRP